ncbi:MAG: hypothetical protein HWN81_02085 [Candidatus Lokiarchaeota archaeon]|nr:hypothetical protein [Candidatus Lokiarchaeota archaeon]
MPRGKKRCPECNVYVGVRTLACDCGFNFGKPKIKKAQKSRVPEKPKINKRKILTRLLEIPKTSKRFFYAREMKLLNDLCNRYSLEFMNVVSFYRKLDSLAYLLSPKLRDTMDKKWRAFNYKLDKSKYKEYNIGDKIGKDKNIKKEIKTTRDFLDE